MKRFIIVSVLFYVISIFGHNIPCLDNQDNLLAIVIMVKNEVDVIIPTLKPFVEAGLNSFLVFDTGSTDGTQDVIRSYFKESGVMDAHIIEEPFIDFSTSRNRALDLAEQLFEQHTFLLMLDAEWYTHDVETLLDFCKQNANYIAPNSTGSCYLMRLFTVQDSINNYVVRLMRIGHNVRYVGPVHETILASPSGIVPTSAYFEYAPQECGKEKSRARLIRDYALLKKSHEDDPANLRTLFYLGQTCQFLHAWEEAIFYYKKRFELGPLSEEKYLAAYRIGYAIEYYLEESADRGADRKYTWEDALHYYLQAHNILPLRAEPLFRIACHYIRNNQHAVAYLFAIRAAQLPYPYAHSLFVENKVYDYLRYDILGQCALYAGEYILGKQAVLKALETAPDSPSLHHNLSVYNQYVTV
jgi:glycosyltransferase involved in cell wall biosynthesis